MSGIASFTVTQAKLKKGNHSISKVKHLNGMYGFKFACCLEKCFTQVYRALYGDAVPCPLEGHLKFSNRSINQSNNHLIICHRVLPLKRKKLQHIVFTCNASSSAITV